MPLSSCSLNRYSSKELKRFFSPHVQNRNPKKLIIKKQLCSSTSYPRTPDSVYMDSLLLLYLASLSISFCGSHQPQGKPLTSDQPTFRSFHCCRPSSSISTLLSAPRLPFQSVIPLSALCPLYQVWQVLSRGRVLSDEEERGPGRSVRSRQ